MTSTRRDYTLIADDVEGILSEQHYDQTHYEVNNLWNDQSVTLSEMIETIKEIFGKKAEINRFPDKARVARRWCAKGVHPRGIVPEAKRRGTAAGALWAQRKQQLGDVSQTGANVTKAKELFGYESKTSFINGVTASCESWKQSVYILWSHVIYGK